MMQRDKTTMEAERKDFAQKLGRFRETFIRSGGIMRQQADVKCYHCGEVSGTWLWPTHASPAVGLFRPASSGHLAIVPLGHLRCLRCQGPVYLDDVESAVQQREIVVERGRRGRPRKLPPLAS